MTKISQPARGDVCTRFKFFYLLILEREERVRKRGESETEKHRFVVLLIIYLFTYISKVLFIFRERGREKKRETSMCGCLSHPPPLGTWPCNPGMCPGGEANQQPFASQPSAQSTEPPHPGLLCYLCTQSLVASCTCPD